MGVFDDLKVGATMTPAAPVSGAFDDMKSGAMPVAKAGLAMPEPWVAPKRGQFMEGVKSAWPTAKADLGRAMQVGGHVFGSEGMADLGSRLAAMGDEDLRAYVPNVGRLEDSKSVGDVWDWVKFNAGAGLTGTIPELAGGAIGGIGGAALAGPKGALFGSMAGAFLPAAMRNVGTLRGMLEEAGITNEDELAQAAIAGSIPAAALEIIMPLKFLKMISRPLQEELANGVLPYLGKAIFSNAAIEGAAEIGSEAVRQATTSLASGKPFDMGVWDAANAGAAGFMLGGAFGAAGAGVQLARGRPAEAQPTDDGKKPGTFDDMKLLPPPAARPALPGPREAAPAQPGGTMQMPGTPGTPPALSDIQQGIVAAAQAEGISPDVAIAIVGAESSFNPNARAQTVRKPGEPLMTAGGLYGHTDATWVTQFKRHEKELKPLLEAEGYTGTLDRDTIVGLKFNSRISSVLGAKLIKETQTGLTKHLGREPTPGELYAGHFFGLPQGKKFLDAVRDNPDAMAADLFANEAKSNPGFFYRRDGTKVPVRVTWARLQARVGGQMPSGDAAPIVVADASVTPPEGQLYDPDTLPQQPEVGYGQEPPFPPRREGEVSLGLDDDDYVAPPFRPRDAATQQAAEPDTISEGINRDTKAQGENTNVFVPPTATVSLPASIPAADRDFILRIADKADSGKRVTVPETRRLTDLAKALGVEVPSPPEGNKLATIDSATIQSLAAMVREPRAAPDPAPVTQQQAATVEQQLPGRAAPAMQEAPLDTPYDPADIEPLADDEDVPYVPPSSFQKAYHASPFNLDRFDPARVGTGQGQTVNGWGVNVSGDVRVGRYYLGQFRGPYDPAGYRSGQGIINGRLAEDFIINEILLPDGQSQIGIVGAAIHDALVVFNTAISEGATPQTAAKRTSQQLREMADASVDVYGDRLRNAPENHRAYQRQFAQRLDDLATRTDIDFSAPGETGGIYTVDIPDDVGGNYLDWDVPLKDQAGAVQSAVAAARREFPDAMAAFDAQAKESGVDMTGAHLHDSILVADVFGGDPDAASIREKRQAAEWLQKHGIDGIRALDTDVDGATNYTVFDASKVRILTSTPSSFQRGDGAATTTVDRRRLADDLEAVDRRGPEYLAKREAISQEISAVIAKMVGDDAVAVQVHDMLLGDGDRVTGAYSPLERLISVSLESADPKATARHETIHALRDLGMIDAQKWRALKNAANKGGWIGKHKIREKYPEAAPDMVYEEAIAEEFANFRRTGTTGNPTIDRIFQALVEFLDSIREVVARQLGYEPSARDIFRAIEDGKMAFARTIEERGAIAYVQEREQYKALLRENGVEVTDADLEQGTLFQRGTLTDDARINRILAKVQPDTSKTLGQTFRERMAGLKATWRQNVEQGVFDKLAAIKWLEKGQYGKILDASVSAYKSARLSQNLSSVMKVVLNDGMIRWTPNGDIQIQTDGFEGGFSGLLKPVVEAGEVDLFRGWLIANRSKRLFSEGRENLLTETEINDLLSYVNARPETQARFVQAQQKWARFNNSVLDFAERAGVINPETRKIWQRDDYVPFYRILEGDMESGPKGKGGIEGQRSGIKQLKGGEQAINNVLENMVANMTHLIDAAFKNDAALKTVDMAVAAGSLTKVPMSIEKRHVTGGALKTALNKIGVNSDKLTKAEREQYAQIVVLTQPKAKSVISVMRNGKPEYYKVDDPFLLSALTELHGTRFDSALMQMMGGAKTFLTRAVTSFPDFMIANIIRETGNAWVVTQGRSNPFKAMKGLVQSYKNDPSALAIAAAGGGTQGFYPTGPGEFAGQFNINRDLSAFRSQARKAWEVWQKIGRATENANRIAAFDKYIKEGASQREAAFQAMDLTDFSMRGDWKAIQFLAHVVPFFNARLQGLYKLGRSAAESRNSAKAFALRGGAITAATMALMAMNDGEDWYEERPNWERDTYYMTRLDDGTILKLPKPFEVGAIFSTIPEYFFRWMSGNAETADVADGMARMFLNTFSFNPIPQAFSPLVEQWANRSFFTGADIVSQGMQRALPKDQISARTSGIGRWSADVFEGVPVLESPARVDALLQAYTGYLGQYLMAVSTGVNDAITGRESPTWDADDYPIARRLVSQGPPTYTQQLVNFYELRNEFNQVVASARRRADVGDVEGAQKLLRDRPDAFAMSRAFNRVGAQISDINAQLRRIRESRTLSGEEKKRQIDPLLRQKADLAKAAITMQQKTEARMVN